MKTNVITNLMLVSALILAGCKTPRSDDGGIRVSTTVVDKVDPPTPTKNEVKDTMRVPGVDKVYIVDGVRVIRSETSDRELVMSDGARRLIVGNGPMGDPTLQPALIEPELAFELARTREQYQSIRVMLERAAVTIDDQKRTSQELAERNRELLLKLEQLAQYAKELELRLEKKK